MNSQVSGQVVYTLSIYTVPIKWHVSDTKSKCEMYGTYCQYIVL